MPKSTQKQRSWSKLSFQQKLLQIAEQTLQQKQRSSITRRLFHTSHVDTVRNVRIYSHSIDNKMEQFVLTIQKSGQHIKCLTRDQHPKRYFKRWGLTLLEDSQQYYCVLGKSPIVEGKTPYESCREIIKSLQTTAARSKTTQQVAPSHNISVQPLSPKESEKIDHTDDIAEEIIALFSNG